MGHALRQIRGFQVAMLASTVLYAVAGEFLAGTVARATPPALHQALTFIAAIVVGATLVVRRTLVLPFEAALKERYEDPFAIRRWKTGYVLLYALCDVLGVFGLILRMLGSTLGMVWGFYLGALLLLAVYSPRESRVRP